MTATVLCDADVRKDTGPGRFLRWTAPNGRGSKLHRVGHHRLTSCGLYVPWNDCESVGRHTAPLGTFCGRCFDL